MDAGYDAASQILEKDPQWNYTLRRDVFLSSRVRGRTLDQLHEDYVELTRGVDQATKDALEESYLAGRSHYDAPGVLQWVVDNVENNGARQRIYRKLLDRGNTDAMFDLMLARHGQKDYGMMMKAIAGTGWSLTREQKDRFVRENKNEAAGFVVTFISHKGSSFKMTPESDVDTVASLNLTPLNSGYPKTLVIPRR